MDPEQILIQEFLDEICERAKRDFKGHLHQAFIGWYVEAEFGTRDFTFTDGPGDNGIDALVLRPGERPPVVVIQSKFSEKFSKTLLMKSAYSEFDQVIDAFYRRGDVFDEWLKTAATGLPGKYRKAKEQLEQAGTWIQEKKAFRLITTHKRRPSEEGQMIPREGYVYGEAILDLYRRYRCDQTPRARHLTLSAERLIPYNDGHRGVKSFLFNTKVSDFRKYLQENDVARAVARNIRFELPGRIGRSIRNTYEKAPQDFWYLHNGLTIVCDELSISKKKATLRHPSIINGAQTLYAISHCDGARNSAEVCVRAIVRGKSAQVAPEDDEWLQRIIRGVNTQNRVRSFDFRSNEPEQITLQRKFREVKVFYERKRGEWRENRYDTRFKSFARTSLPGLGKLLTAVREKNGSGPLLVKRGVDELFEDRNYGKLFPSKSKMNSRFPKIYFSHRLYELLYSLGYDSTRQQRRQRHAFWHSFWLLHWLSGANDGLLKGLSVDQIKKAFDLVGTRPIDKRGARRAMKAITKAAWKTWEAARKRDPESITSVNFFKTKDASRLLLRKGSPLCRQEVTQFFQRFRSLAHQ
jgi:hypothetical protein